MKPLLSIENISVAGRLFDATLQIFPGEFVGLIGPNGAGKTTLLRAAIGMIPAGGTSSLLAHKIAARPRHVAYLAQEREVVWPISVREVVALGRRAHPDCGGDDQARADAILQALDLSEFANRQIPDLSGGERARVLLARALAQGAPLLLADEPCAALDPIHSIRTAKLLRDEALAGRAALATLHDLPLAARWCTRLVVIERGVIVADGTPDQVLAPELCRRVFGISLTRHGQSWLLEE
ncbi:ABC transporter ATP-binding protein [Falsigemmobacter intermedius]|uniref:ABC transporter ATP-binding protein n=1 Tax=Falsigemmobacter intermedius TaxID=1553448 RepID=A0A3S3VM83_9RHOB|nr:ABC transporter ATP-binding protein [Falsigemmobacter intermedius]RWY38828.1 ABC transporter ATP-binding protein [Falsigemmobacter intermedius]